MRFFSAVTQTAEHAPINRTGRIALYREPVCGLGASSLLESPFAAELESLSVGSSESGRL